MSLTIKTPKDFPHLALPESKSIYKFELMQKFVKLQPFRKFRKFIYSYNEKILARKGDIHPGLRSTICFSSANRAAMRISITRRMNRFVVI
jgi:hypothetical protein